MQKMRSLVSVLLLALCNPTIAADFQHPTKIVLDHNGRMWAQNTLKKLSLEEKIGQLFMIRILGQFVNLENPEYLKWHDQITRYHVGSVLLTVPSEGPFLYKTEPYEAAMLINQLQRDAQLPLIVAADFERGLSMRLQGVTVFPHAMAFAAAGDTELVERYGRIVAQESRAMGVQWNFFPDADVNSNPANPIINIRSFGEDPKQVSSLVDAYIRSARREGMLTTVKHFPGHGDTGTDSHLGVAAVNRSRQDLDQVDLVPFRNAIAAGVDAVLVAHVTVPALEPSADKVATTSPAVISGLLKQELGFKGLVVTDALEMGGLTRLYPQPGPEAAGRAAVDAIKAGNDLLVLPSDLEGAYEGILSAVRSKEISEARIDESVLKILRAKASVGLNKSRLVDINTMSSAIAKPDSLAFAQHAANAAVTLVRENGRVLPLQRRIADTIVDDSLPDVTNPKHPLVCLIFTDDPRTQSGRQLERELRVRIPDVSVIYVDPNTSAALAAEVQRAINLADAVMVAVYMVPTSGKVVKTEGMVVTNSISLAEAPAALLNAILRSAAGKTVVISLGSPYIAADFLQIENYVCVFSDVPVSESAAVKAIFGEIPIQGRLPVTIPGFAERGSGIQKPEIAR